MKLTDEQKQDLRQIGPESFRDALDYLAAGKLHKAGKFETLDKALAWVEGRRTRERTLRNCVDKLHPDEFKKALYALDQEWEEKIPPGSELEKEIHKAVVNIVVYPEQIERLKKELETEREARRKAEEEAERLKKKRPPAKTALPGHYMDNLFYTENSAEEITRSPELQTDLIKRQKIEGMIVKGQVGLDLDVYELRVMQGIFNLTTDNPEPERIRLRSWNEFYRACGVRETNTGSKIELDKQDKMVTYNSFLQLRDKNFDMIIKEFKGYDKKAKERIYDIAVVREPLYKTAFFYQDIAEGKILEVADQLHDPDKYDLKEIVILPNRLVLRNYSDYWRLVDSTLYHDIRGALRTGERISKYDMRFILWLNRHGPGQEIVQTNVEALARELGMDEYLKPEKRWRRIHKVLIRAYRIAYELGYLKRPAGHKIQAKRGGTKEVFHLNPAKVIHARQKLLPGIKVDN